MFHHGVNVDSTVSFDAERYPFILFSEHFFKHGYSEVGKFSSEVLYLNQCFTEWFLNVSIIDLLKRCQKFRRDGKFELLGSLS